jgi:hypothetical protein
LEKAIELERFNYGERKGLGFYRSLRLDLKGLMEAKGWLPVGEVEPGV